MKRALGYVGFGVGALFALAAEGRAVPASYSLSDADTVLKNDFLDDRSLETVFRAVTRNRQPAVGDFDGDGRGDLAVLVNGAAGFEVLVVPGEATIPSGPFSERARVRVQLPPHPPNPFPPPVGLQDRVALGDTNGDGRAELVITHLGRLYVYNGRPWPAIGTIWNGTHADIRLEGLPNINSLALGDVTGDGRSDFLFQAGPSIFLHKGRPEPSPSVYIHGVTTPSFADAQIFPAAYGDGQFPQIGDVTGDGINDIGLSPVPPIFNITNRIQAVWGSSTPPAVVNFSLTPPPLTLEGRVGMSLDLVGLCDIDADGRADLVTQDLNLPSAVYLWRGADVIGRPSIDAGAAGLRYPLLPLNPLPLDGFGCGDIDGDGRNDLMLSNPSSAQLFLTTQGSFDGWLSGGGLAAAISVLGQHGGSTLGDVDGDGLSDLVLFDFYGPAGTLSSFYSALYLFHGYHPLSHPSFSLDPRRDDEARVTARLSVDGDPTGMRFTGDVADPAPGVWIPYAAHQRLTLSPAAGNKRLAVTFRNRRGRISETVELSTPLVPGERGPRVVTNRIRRGERARVEVQRLGGQTPEAWVETTGGTLVRELPTGNVVDGVEILEWDGTDAAGRSVAPGVYHFHLIQGERRDTHRVLVVP